MYLDIGQSIGSLQHPERVGLHLILHHGGQVQRRPPRPRRLGRRAGGRDAHAEPGANCDFSLWSSSGPLSISQ